VNFKYQILSPSTVRQPAYFGTFSPYHVEYGVIMPWDPSDAPAHDRKASTPAQRRQWAAVANSVLAKTGDDGRAVRTANGVVKPRGRGRASNNVVRVNRRPMKG
jgi:hypothetical protein